MEQQISTGPGSPESSCESPGPFLNSEQRKLAIAFNFHQDFSPELIGAVQILLEVRTTRFWDDTTVMALAAWQAWRGIPSTGVLDAKTEQAVRAALAEQARQTSDGARHHDLTRPLHQLLADAVKEAEKDWMAGTDETYTKSDGRLAAIFRDSGYSSGVETTSDGKIIDWCGMAVGAWLYRVGISERIKRTTFLATSNVSDFFTYNPSPTNSGRTMTRVRFEGRDLKISELHEEKGTLRRFTNAATVRATDLAKLDIKPGDVVLINHLGKTDGAHHITMVRKWSAPILETIEGNATGKRASGATGNDAVVVNARNLSSTTERNKIYGIGRVSSTDFLALNYYSSSVPPRP